MCYLIQFGILFIEFSKRIIDLFEIENDEVSKVSVNKIFWSTKKIGFCCFILFLIGLFILTFHLIRAYYESTGDLVIILKIIIYMYINSFLKHEFLKPERSSNTD